MRFRELFIREAMDYIIPPMPPPGIAGIAGASDFFSANTHFRGKEHRSDRSRILQRHTRNLGRVDDTRFEQVLITVVAGVVTEGAFALLHLIDNHRTLAAGIRHDLTQRLFDSAFYDLDTGRLVFVVALSVSKASTARM